MRFAQDFYAHGFWVVFFAIFFLWLALRQKKALLGKFAEPEMLKEIASSVSFKKQILKSSIIIIALLSGLLALMRPQWGFKWQEVKREGLDILIAMDVSKSMLATDVKPDRLERSKLAVQDLVKKLKGDRIGLIAFSGTAFLQCPLTSDYNGFLLGLNDLYVGIIPRGGTSISSAIETALKSFESGYKKYKALIIVTDGENHEGDPLRLAEKAKQENVKICCIGIGTMEGELIQVTDENGKRVFLKDKEGNVVKSRLNEDILKRIAAITEGTYVRSSGAEFGLDLLYEERLSKLEKREIKAEMSRLYYERFQLPLAFGLVLLIIEPFITDRKKT